MCSISGGGRGASVIASTTGGSRVGCSMHGRYMQWKGCMGSR